MGSTRGALLGGIIGIGLAFGRDVLEDSTTSQSYARAMDRSMELCQRFEKEFGSSECWDIQRSIFGRSFDLRDPRGREEFRKAGGFEKCPQVAQRAAELAAAVILDGGYQPGSKA